MMALIFTVVAIALRGSLLVMYRLIANMLPVAAHSMTATA